MHNCTQFVDFSNTPSVKEHILGMLYTTARNQTVDKENFSSTLHKIFEVSELQVEQTHQLKTHKTTPTPRM